MVLNHSLDLKELCYFRFHFEYPGYFPIDFLYYSKEFLLNYPLLLFSIFHFVNQSFFLHLTKYHYSICLLNLSKESINLNYQSFRFHL